VSQAKLFALCDTEWRDNLGGLFSEFFNFHG
jgi:hypothetical protein